MARLKRSAIIRSLVLAVILPIAFPASAGYFQSGNDLVKYMKAYEKDTEGRATDYTEADRYVAFVVGVTDSLEEIEFCLPERPTVQQVCAVVAKYLNAHPETWDQPAFRLVAAALKQAFPCKK